MTYAELLRRLFAARRFGVELGLDRMRAAFAPLGLDARCAPVVVQIGGTNGKGSAVAFTEAIARASGARVGAYTSPHLVRFAERFRLDGAPADEAAIAEVGARVVEVGERLGLTFFELATLIALRLFRDAGVDVAVLEVGLGGRLDATTAAEVDVAAITGVDLDHAEYLGDTLEAIAAEKAGIARAGVPVVIGASGDPRAVPWLEQRARAAGASRVVVVGRDAPAAPPAGWEIALAGSFQAANAACALAVADLLGMPEDARRRGLAAARCPGRFERVGADPQVILDGAHNPAAARALAGALAGAPYGLVLGVSAGKDLAGIAGPLAGGAAYVIATRSSSERSAGPAEVAAAVPGAAVVPEPAAAIDAAVREARARGVARVVVAGSLFLVGDARVHLCGDVPDQIAVQDPLGARPWR